MSGELLDAEGGEGSWAASKVLSTRVELAVKAKGIRNADILSLSDPICVLYKRETENQNFREHGRTEMIKDDLNPEWVRKFQLDYYFEEKQYLRFELYDIDKDSPDLKHHDPLGCAECKLSDLVASMSFSTELQSLKGKAAKGKIEIQAEELSSCKEIATLQWKATGLEKQSKLKKPKAWIQMSKENPDLTWTPVWRSEKQSGVDVTWDMFTIPVLDLCNGVDDRQLRVVCFDESNKNRPVGEFYTSWRVLSTGRSHANTYQLHNQDMAKKRGDKYTHSGTIELALKSSKLENTFVDYIKGGMQIEVTVAIDFTKSNGDPRKPDSLHHISSNSLNPYAKAIKAVVGILEDYDTDKLIPVYGFGAVERGCEQTSMMFPLNENKADPSCFKLAGVMEAYQSALTRVTLHGPTYFSPIIEQVASETAKVMDGSKYGVLLIITDGVIDDMPKTIKAIIDASRLPLSIIIIGVGNENFKAMERLDSDHCLLSYGKFKAERDIVQFVAMKDFPSAASPVDIQQQQLAKEVLAEVPYQITSFMHRKSIHPRQPRNTSCRVK